MAFSATEHVQKAQANEDLARSLGTATVCSLEWAVTINFYAALHYVQGYFATQKITFSLHTNRATAIARDARLKHIYPDYREMRDSSEAARYEVNGVKFEDLANSEACLARVKEAIQRVSEV